MENITDNILTDLTETNLDHALKSIDLVVANEAVDRLITEGGEAFYNYVKLIGLANDNDLVVLSSRYNYYYDSEEMNNVKTVINLKEFNRIRQIKSLLNSHLSLLPEHCNFIGCFVNNKKVERYSLRNNPASKNKIENSVAEELGIVSKFPFINMLYSILDAKTDSYMSEKSVTLMLAVHGFKVMNMTEVNGLTFFHSLKKKLIFN